MLAHSATCGGTLNGFGLQGALKELSPTHGEIKSMRTPAANRGRGAGRAVLAHIISVARQRGHKKLSLETGTHAAFEPAHNLYRSQALRLQVHSEATFQIRTATSWSSRSTEIRTDSRSSRAATQAAGPQDYRRVMGQHRISMALHATFACPGKPARPRLGR